MCGVNLQQSVCQKQQIYIHIRRCETIWKSDNVLTGRKEITTFFYFYTLLTVASLVIDCGVVPPGSGPYPYFVAAQCGLASATCLSLMINGFVGFQLYEDGTTLSVWLLRLCSLAMFLISFAVSLLTFKGWAGLGPENTVGLFVVVYLFSAMFLAVYVVMQLVLVLGTLQERWPLLHIFFGVLAFVIGQIILYVFSQTICDKVEHYMDGLFFATLLNLLAVMMVYKVGSRRMNQATAFSLTRGIVLGLHHERRPRILCRPKAEQLGGQGTPPRREQAKHHVRRKRLRRQHILPATHWTYVCLRRFRRLSMT